MRLLRARGVRAGACAGLVSGPGERPPTVTTSRLRLRAPEPADTDALFAIQGDPETMRFTYFAPDRDATQRFLASYAERFAVDGFAPWTACLEEDDRVVGWGGLNRDPKEPQWGVEVAYFIDPAFAGRGFATEIVGASLALAFDELGLPAVDAFTRPANRASARVLEKSGFTRVGFEPAIERDRYRVAASAWRASR